jgi:Phosphotransferase enzyme family
MMNGNIGGLVAAGNVAEVFEWGRRVVKLYRSPAGKPAAFREAAIHAAVEAMGLPVPAVWGVQQIIGRWGIIFDRVSEASFAAHMRANPSATAEHLDILARLYTQILAHPAHWLGSQKIKLATNIARTELLSESRKQKLLQCLVDMPEGDCLCHGDFHPGNVLGDGSRPMVIDWPDACRGNPAADICRSYLLLKLHAADIAEPYLDAWCRITDAGRGKVCDWMPFVAAARLAEEVPDEFDRLLQIAGS